MSTQLAKTHQSCDADIQGLVRVHLETEAHLEVALAQALGREHFRREWSRDEGVGGGVPRPDVNPVEDARVLLPDVGLLERVPARRWAGRGVTSWHTGTLATKAGPIDRNGELNGEEHR